VVDQGDELERGIRRILKKFDADTKRGAADLQEAAAVLHRAERRPTDVPAQVYARSKKQYWPIITKEFSASACPRRSPSCLAGVELRPLPQTPVGARGMWQFMDSTARRYGPARVGELEARG